MLGSLPYREAVRAPATRRTYRSLWRHWEQFALVEGWEPLPADAGCLAEYIEQRGQAGDTIATLKLRRYAIAQYHKQNEHGDPTATDDFRAFMAGVARQHGRPPSQATGLTSDDLSRIRLIVRTPTDRRDIAICHVMRDAMLRRSEAAALTWLDIESQPDGSGVLTIRRSKMDQESRGTMQYLSHAAMIALDAIRPPDAEGSIFGLCDHTISRRITAICRRAGLRGGYTGHSPRVGMAQDLAYGGCGLPELQQAGRWRSPNLPARYIRRQTLARSAVAKYYNKAKGE